MSTGAASNSSGQPPRRRPPDLPPETENERRLINILIIGFVLFVVGAGLWLGDALLEARRMDECMAAGRRNCAPITPQPQLPQR